MQQLKKSLSTRFRERLADPIFLLLLIGFVIVLFAYLADFKVSSMASVFKTEPKLQTQEEIDQQKYLEAIYDNREKLLPALEEVNNLLDNVDNQTPEWKADIASKSEVLIGICSEINNIQPPDKYKKYHEMYALALLKYKEAMTCLSPAPGMPIFASDLEDAKKLRRSADKYFKDAQDMLSTQSSQ